MKNGSTVPDYRQSRASAPGHAHQRRRNRGRTNAAGSARGAGHDDVDLRRLRRLAGGHEDRARRQHDAAQARRRSARRVDGGGCERLRRACGADRRALRPRVDGRGACAVAPGRSDPCRDPGARCRRRPLRRRARLLDHHAARRIGPPVRGRDRPRLERRRQRLVRRLDAARRVRVRGSDLGRVRPLRPPVGDRARARPRSRLPARVRRLRPARRRRAGRLAQLRVRDRARGAHAGRQPPGRRAGGSHVRHPRALPAQAAVGARGGDRRDGARLRERFVAGPDHRRRDRRRVRRRRQRRLRRG